MVSISASYVTASKESFHETFTYRKNITIFEKDEHLKGLFNGLDWAFDNLNIWISS
jgi:hypothetical protein